MNVIEKLTETYMDRMFSTERGRAHVLNQLADAEDSDEGWFFDSLLAQVEDSALQKMISRHAADEKRHAEMFRQCVRRQGFEPEPVPNELKLMDYLNREVDGILDRPVVTPEHVMDAYLLLQVIEERAITQFGQYEPLMRRYDPASADVLLEVAKDEARHLKYCRAISRRYATDEETRIKTLHRFREAEAHAFATTTSANMLFALEHHLLPLNSIQRAFWRSVDFVSSFSGRLEKTSFWQEPVSVPA